MNKNLYPHMKILQSKKLYLRPITLDDAKDIFEYLSQENVVKYLPIKAHKNINETKKFISNYFINNYENNKYSHYAVVYKKENKGIGNMGFNNMKIGSQTGELGICINPKYWGNKFSQELLAIMLPHCFTDLNLKEVTTVVYEDNKFSLKPLQVYNFKYSKSYNVKVKNKIIKCNVYSLSRKDYFNNR